MNLLWNYANGRREYEVGHVTIYDFERGLLYNNGAFQRVLEAGRYRLWSWNRSRIVVVDVRRQTTEIANQKLLTSDQLTVGINLVADYEISDVALSVHSVANATTQIYSDVQLAARSVVGAVDVNTLLQNRAEINAQLQVAVAPLASRYGLNVLSVAIKDVVLAAKVRDMLMREAEAKRVALATLIGAREEVAALRALANAAQMIEKNPALLRLRELDMARSFAGNAGNTLVMGVGEISPISRNRGFASPTVEATEDEEKGSAGESSALPFFALKGKTSSKWNVN